MIEGEFRRTHVLGYLDCCGVQPESGFWQMDIAAPYSIYRFTAYQDLV